jgi:Ca2+-binding RTX toxin-like protein
VSGGAGGDVYQFDAFSGHDVITEAIPALTQAQLASGLGPVYVIGDGDAPTSSDVDVLNLNGIAVSDVVATRTGDDLLLTVQSTAASVTVTNYFANGVPTIEKIVFTSSGTTWTSSTVKALVLLPTGGNDMLVGYLGGDKISGGDGNDWIDGREGNDTLTGGAGNDTLTGGIGSDRFVLDQGSGVDTITDFTSAVDTIVLKGSVFTGLGAVGARIGLSDKLLYDADSGLLTYDADGAGGNAGVLVAILGTDTHPASLGLDFVIG